MSMLKSENKNSARNNIHLFDYNYKGLEERYVKNIDECVPYKKTKTVTWINIDQVPPVSFLDELQLGFNLHPIVVEDILNINQRPKVEELSDYIFLAIKMFSFDKKTNKIFSEQVSIILASNFLITFQQGIKGDNFDSIRKLLRQGGSRIRSLGTDYLCYEIIDSIVSNYFTVLDDFSDNIERLEQEMIQKPLPVTLNKIYNLKRQVLELRKSIWPLRETIRTLESGESGLINDSTKIYLRDTYESIVQIVDVIEIYRDILSGMLEVYLSSISNRTNSVMKVLTIITTIFMPISFMAGFFGMNFKYLPGIGSPIMLIAVSFLMGAVVIMMLSFFKVKKWI